MLKLLSTMLVLVMLMVSISSQGLSSNGSKCFTPRQLREINKYRLECEACKLDLVAAMKASKEVKFVQTPADNSLAVLVGVGSLILGAVIGAAVAERNR